MIGSLLCAAVLLAAANIPSTTEIDALLARADDLTSARIRRSSEAIVIYREAIAQAERSGDIDRQARGWVGLSRALIRVHRQKESVAAGERALVLARASGKLEVESQAMRRIGAVANERGEYERAETIYRRLYELGARDPAIRLRGLNNLSVNSRDAGRLTQAIAWAREGAALLPRVEPERVPHELHFSIPYNLGRALIDSGELSAGFIHMQRALEAAERYGHIGGMWHVLHDTAMWYEVQGQMEKAAHYYARAFAQSAKMDSLDPQATTLRGMASLELKRGNATIAVGHAQRAVELFEKAGYRKDVAPALVMLSRALRAAGRGGEALEELQRAQRAASDLDQPLGLALVALEEAAQRGDDGPAAVRHAEETLELIERVGLRSLAPTAHALLAELARRRGDLDSAARSYEQAASAVDDFKGNISSPELQAAFTEAAHATYRGLFEVKMERHRREPTAGRAVAAFLVIERERAPRTDDAPGDGAERQRWLHEVAQLQTRLMSPSLAPELRGDLLRRLHDAERTLDAASSSSRRDAGRIRVSDLQRLLDASERFVAYALIPGRIVAFVIGPRDIQVVETDAPPNLDWQIDLFTSLIVSGTADDVRRAGSSLSGLLVDPVIGHVGTARRLLVSAPGALAGIPFQALTVSGSRDLLVHRYEVAFASSLTSLAAARRHQETMPRAFLGVASPLMPLRSSLMRAELARPLALAEKEVRDIARLVAGPSDILLSGEASEVRLKRLPLREYKVVHFATHAILDAAIPSRSAILLDGGAPSEDGWIQPREIEDLGVRGIVVLSGCETAAGRVSSAEGMQSLSRAFGRSGAPAIVGTLWRVDDANARAFMRRFYRHLIAGGEPVGAALRQAQLETAGHDPHANAGIWAAWVVSGDPAARSGIAPSRPILFPLAIGAALIALLTVGLALVWRRA